jgi:hypothetical protein
MPRTPEETKRLQSLLTSLVILTIAILALVLVITAYPSVIKPILAPATPRLPTLLPTAAASLTPTITLTPTASRTLRPSLTPSITPSPSQTPSPTITLTPPGPATLTPARPVAADPYKLVPWSPEFAEQAIALLEDYPNLLPEDARSPDDQGYRQAFQYAALAQKEALLRFPDAPQASLWRLGLAYNLAKTGDPQAGDLYAELIAKALNQGETKIDELGQWLEDLEPRLKLGKLETKPPPGFLSSHLLELSGPGSVFIHLLQSNSGYQAQALDASLDLTSQPAMRTLLSDLDGDGLEEAAFFNSSPSGTTLETPRVFNLSDETAQELPFRTGENLLNIGMQYTNYWRVVKNQQGGNDLQFTGRLFPVCPVNIQRTYHWDGKNFVLSDEQYQVEPVQETSNLCGYIVDHASSIWGPKVAIQIMESLLPTWPPATMENGQPFPAGVKDEWRYRLGIYHALAGNPHQAVRYMTQVVDQPADPKSQWIQLAQEFLAAYKKPEDIYRACVDAGSCNPAFALDYLVNTLYDSPANGDILQYLAQSGVQLRSSGYFDFDQDGQTERWFTIRHRPLAKLELWIMASTKDGSQALYVGNIDSDVPALTILEKTQSPPVVQVEQDFYLSMLRDPETGFPYLVYPKPASTAALLIPTLLDQELAKARLALFSGEDPGKIASVLGALFKNVAKICQARPVCDELLYLLGLSNELAGNDREAIAAYRRLWLDYAQSPFTTLARLKLISAYNTPTPTQTLTPTTTLTPTPTATLGSPTPTITPGGTTSPPGTPTATPTSPGAYPPPIRTATSPVYPIP